MRVATKISPQEATQMREEWLRAINDLARQVTGWAEQQGWTVTRAEREINELPLGAYTAPVLQIDTHLPTGYPDETGQVVLEPIAQNVAGADGRVDLSVWPAGNRVILLRRTDQTWVVHTDSGIDWPYPWSESTFLDLTRRLTGVR